MATRTHTPVRLLAASMLGAAALAGIATPSRALEACRLLRQPDIQGNVIVFAYAGDLWKVARTGGLATRLTSSEGQESFPKLSPDGRTVAFTGEYDGNTDVFTIPIDGGEPTRLTWHPLPDRVAEWYPDGKALLIRSGRSSAPVPLDRFYKVGVSGGFEQPVPLPVGDYASLSADGQEIAFNFPGYDNRTWKRYRGGEAGQIWTYDFAHNTSRKITDWRGSNEWPMWYRRTVYYASDQGGRRANLWAYDVDTRARRQVTKYDDDDVKWPSIGSDGLVFEKGGSLFVMDLPSEKITRIQVMVPDDKPGTRAEYRNVAGWMGGWDLSPQARRVVVEARGDIFTVPAEKGDVRNLTHSPASRERAPAWSPDGKWIAYFSDRTGEYEIWLSAGDGKADDRQVTHGLGVYPFKLGWSPDSKKLAFTQCDYSLSVCDIAGGSITRVGKGLADNIEEFAWAPDSRWLAYTRVEKNDRPRVWLYSLETRVTSPIADGMSADSDPCFDPDGRYLYFLSLRTFQPQLSPLELEFQVRNGYKIYAVTLRDTVPSPAGARADEETGEADKPSDKPRDDAKAGAAADIRPLQIDLAGLPGRITALPIHAGNYGNILASKKKVLYLEFGDPEGDGDGPVKATLHAYDLDKREDKVVISGVDGAFAVSQGGGKVLYKAGPSFGIIEPVEGKKIGDGKVDASALMATVDPKAEWLQMFNEAWRLERDFYYDPAMGGLDWKAIGEHYRALVPYAGHRSDLNYIIGEMIGELGTGHSYVGGGDVPGAPRVSVGLLGADYELDAASGLYRFRKIYRERDWNSRTVAPLGEPGVGVREGDYLLAVNGQPVKSPMNVYAAFAGLADKVVRLTVGANAHDPRPRTVLVQAIGNESGLRYTDWVNTNRRKVEQATGGKVAYIHLPNTSYQGIQEFCKQYYAQTDHTGLIVDERFNGGGFNPEFYIDRLRKETWIYRSRRDGEGVRQPSASMDGPKCMLINQWAGSGGDSFPYYFRFHRIGPLIGERTWGGLVGLYVGGSLVDGGFVTMPQVGAWDKQGQWIVENRGVAPDVEVENTPETWAVGRDAQLERAINYCNEQLKANPVPPIQHPPYRSLVGDEP